MPDDPPNTGRLSAGGPAPDFTANTVDGDEVKLSDFRGKPLWLAFFRYAMCPLCNFRIHQLIQAWPEKFESRDMTMLGVFQSPAHKLERLVERHSPPFRVIANPEMELYKLYRIETKWGGAFGAETRAALKGAAGASIPLIKAWDGPPHRVPADFLIDGDGKIREVFYGENISQHIPFERVEDFLDAVGG